MSKPADRILETMHDLQRLVREHLPNDLADVDAHHIKKWGSLDPAYTFSWFESLAYALNADMRRSAGQARFSVIVDLMRQALQGSSSEVRECIDVAFVENLFWDVGPHEAEPSWQRLPASFKDLCVAFHGYTPLKV